MSSDIDIIKDRINSNLVSLSFLVSQFESSSPHSRSTKLRPRIDQQLITVETDVQSLSMAISLLRSSKRNGSYNNNNAQALTENEMNDIDEFVNDIQATIAQYHIVLNSDDQNQNFNSQSQNNYHHELSYTHDESELYNSTKDEGDLNDQEKGPGPAAGVSGNITRSSIKPNSKPHNISEDQRMALLTRPWYIRVIESCTACFRELSNSVRTRSESSIRNEEIDRALETERQIWETEQKKNNKKINDAIKLREQEIQLQTVE